VAEAAKSPPADPNHYRILAVDDEKETPNELRREFEGVGDIYVAPHVATVDGAEQYLRAHYVDALCVDMKFGADPWAGLEVVRHIGALAPTAEVVVCTQLADVARGLRSNRSTKFVDIIEKTELEAGWALRLFGPSVESWRGRHVTIEGADLVVDLLDAKQRRSRIPGVRSRSEVAIEVDRLCREIFGRVEGIGKPVRVRFRALDRAGLSSAAAVIAEVHIGQDANEDELPGAVTVLKVGPVADIKAEAARYEAFVKYGVRMTHRVELLGHAYGHTLGAISYSFAGGLFGEQLTSLDDLLKGTDRGALVDESLEELFSVSSRNWYRVNLPDEPPRYYFQEESRIKSAESYDWINGSLRGLRNSLSSVTYDAPEGRERAGQLRIPDAPSIIVPSRNVWGTPPFIVARPRSLIHGDMHGGNVMVELNTMAEETSRRLRRVCLIDFRHSGPGPRLLDFVALESSVRLADAHAIVVSHGVERESELEDDVLLAALTETAHRLTMERSLARERYDGDPVPRPELWQQQIVKMYEMATWNFEGITPSEHQVTAALYVFRQMALHLGPISRVRLLAWLDVLIERLLPAAVE
jgi:CheY-like chemotaxis protein